MMKQKLAFMDIAEYAQNVLALHFILNFYVNFYTFVSNIFLGNLDSGDVACACG